jgi:hypothetical protein
MTKLVYDIQENRIDDLWTTERLKEEAFLSLARIQEKIVNEQGESVTVRKYYRQAREKMYWIPISNPIIPFIIHISDLSGKVRNELDDYCKTVGKRALTHILNEIAGKFFENLDFEYYHGSMIRNLIVRLEQ